MKIINYGSLNLDHVYGVQHIVQPGETISSLSRTVNAGGKGLNQSIALAQAGAQVWHAGAIGREGKILRDTLRQAGVNTEYLLCIEDAATGHAVIQVDATGQNSIILYGGANQLIPTGHINTVLSGFGRGDFLLLQNEVNNNAQMMRAAHEKGMTIVLNPSPMDEKVLALPLEYVDWFVVNELEAAALCGGAGEALLAQYPGAGVVLTLGSRGVECHTAGRRYTHGTYRVPVVDTTAAGDTFSGYFIAALADGKSIETTLALASAASSIAVSRAGASASIPRLAEVLGHTMEYVPFPYQ